MESLLAVAIASLVSIFTLWVIPVAVYRIRYAYLTATFEFFREVCITSNHEKDNENAP